MHSQSRMGRRRWPAASFSSAPHLQCASKLCCHCSVWDTQAQMQLGLYIPEMKGLGACRVEARLGFSRSTLSWVQSNPSSASPGPTCSAASARHCLLLQPTSWLPLRICLLFIFLYQAQAVPGRGTYAVHLHI